MKTALRNILLWSLAGAFLLLSGVAYPQAVAHAAHHAHHKATTHATVFCSWTCATTGAASTDAIVLDGFALVQMAALPLSSEPPSVLSLGLLPSRAPPSVLF